MIRHPLLHLTVVLIAVACALGVATASAAPPPPWLKIKRDVPGRHFGTLSTPFQYIGGTLSVGGKTCLGSGGSTGCFTDYVAGEALDVIDPGGNPAGPIVRLMSDRPENTPAAWWDLQAFDSVFNIADVAGGTVPFVLGGGAPDFSFVVDPLGHVGVGTFQPVSRMQVGPGSVAPLTAGASLTVEEGTASAQILKSTSGQEMFVYVDPNNGLMGTASNTPFGLRSNNHTRLWVAASGNVGIGEFLVNPTHLLQLNGGAFSDGATWNNASSRSLKENFAATDDQSVLQKLASLPVDSWNYKTDGAGVRHLGPTAEDFKAAFDLGSDDKSIATVDADGVAMAAIKGLYEEGQAKDTRIADLESRLAKLERGTPPAGRAAAPGHEASISSQVLLVAIAGALVGAVAVAAAQRLGSNG